VEIDQAQHLRAPSPLQRSGRPAPKARSKVLGEDRNRDAAHWRPTASRRRPACRSPVMVNDDCELAFPDRPPTPAGPSIPASWAKHQCHHMIPALERFCRRHCHRAARQLWLPIEPATPVFSSCPKNATRQNRMARLLSEVSTNQKVPASCRGKNRACHRDIVNHFPGQPCAKAGTTQAYGKIT